MNGPLSNCSHCRSDLKKYTIRNARLCGRLSVKMSCVSFH